jgi:hypothetical protein
LICETSSVVVGPVAQVHAGQVGLTLLFEAA